jgi:hypothetical protein
MTKEEEEEEEKIMMIIIIMIIMLEYKPRDFKDVIIPESSLLLRT